jgi:hypothetical protein
LGVDGGLLCACVPGLALGCAANGVGEDMAPRLLISSMPRFAGACKTVCTPGRWGKRAGPGGWVGNPRRLLRRGDKTSLLSFTYYIVGTRSPTTSRGRLRCVRGPRSSCLCVCCVGIGAMSSMGLSLSQRWNREPHRRRVRRMSQVDGKVACGPAGFCLRVLRRGLGGAGVVCWADL